MPAQDNAYEAPQTTDLRAANDRPHGLFARRFPVKYLWQGMARGLAAGSLASISIILLYLVRMLSGYQADAVNLLLITGAFIFGTVMLGLVWGIAYACFATFAPDAFPEWNDATRTRDETRGES